MVSKKLQGNKRNRKKKHKQDAKEERGAGGESRSATGRKKGKTRDE